MLGVPRVTSRTVFRGQLAGAIALRPAFPDRDSLPSAPPIALDASRYLVECDFDENLVGTLIGLNLTGDPAQAALVIDRCRFRRNVAELSYGVVLRDAAFNSGTDLPATVISNSSFVANVTLNERLNQFGAFFALNVAPVRVVNSLFYGNRVPIGEGAALSLYGNYLADPVLDPYIQNSIFWNNVGDYGSGPAGAILVGGNHTITSSIIEGWAGPESLGSTAERVTYSNVSGADPLFRDPEGPDGVLGTDDDDFTLSSASPALDAGTIGLPAAATTPGFQPFAGPDLGGGERVIDLLGIGGAGAIDIGPFELNATGADLNANGVFDVDEIAADPGLDLDEDGFIDATQRFEDCDADGVLDSVAIAQGLVSDLDSDGTPDVCQIAADASLDADGNGVLDAGEPRTFHVDDDAAAGGDGLSWGGAFDSLSDALERAAERTAATTIKLAEGSYAPRADLGRFSTFTIPTRTSVLGGFAGVGAADPDARSDDPSATVLSGDLGGDMGRAFHVVTIRNDDAGFSDPALENVTVRDGDARGTGFLIQVATGEFTIATRGAGLRVPEGVAFVRGVSFEDNDAAEAGDHVASHSDVSLEDASFGVGAEAGESSLVYVGRPTAGGVPPVRLAVFGSTEFANPRSTEVIASDGASIDVAGLSVTEGPKLFRFEEVGQKPRAVDFVARSIRTRPGVNIGFEGVFEVPLSIDIADSELGGRIADVDVLRSTFSASLERTVVVSRSGTALRASASAGEPASDVSLFANNAIFGAPVIVTGGSANPAIVTFRNVTATALTLINRADLDIRNSIFASGAPSSSSLFLSGITDLDALTFNIIEGAGASGLLPMLPPSNVDADPRFVDALGFDMTPNTGDEDLTPALDSPAIDAGKNAFVVDAALGDAIGGDRLEDVLAVGDTGVGEAPIVDIGAIEVRACAADTNDDGAVNAADLLGLLAWFGRPATGSQARYDLNGDGVINADDLLIVLGNFGAVCD